MKMRTSSQFKSYLKFMPLLTLFFFVLMLSSFVRADDVSDQINTWSDTLSGLEKQISDLDKNVGQPLTAEKARLLDTDDLLKGAEKNLDKKYEDLTSRVSGPNGYSAQLQAHQAKIAPFNARTADYNRRCDITTSDASYVDACNREKAQLDAEADAFEREYVQLKNLQAGLKQEKVDLDDYAKGLRDRRNDLNQATLDWAAKMKKYNADRNDLVASYNHALEQLKQLSNQYSNCVRNLPPDATDEYIKHHCGNVQFDNVRENLQKLQNIKPEFVITPN
jgi:chromosome segregation ATPase